MTENEKASLLMARFRGRQDVFAVAWTSAPDESGNVRKGYTPSCENKWQVKNNITCYLKKAQPGKSCSNCEIHAYTPVTTESVLRHIHNIERQACYLLLPDGTSWFGAVDFDMKPGKENEGYSFEDVQKFCATLERLQIPYGLARSSNSGHHVYFFFDKPMLATRFRSFGFWILDAAGLMEGFRMGLRPLPEIFPKQTSIAQGVGLGNSITLPLIEPRMAQGRNCFITPDNHVIPQQWEHFSTIPYAYSRIEELITSENITVMESISNASGVGYNGGVRSEWQAPLTGSLEKVLEGCKAFRKLRDKLVAGETPNHNEGFALYHLAMSTKGGIDWFKSNVPGWAQDDAQVRQLEQSLRAGYKPWTCKRLQEAGVCVMGTKCFDRRPPLERIEGQLVARTDVPEHLWPEPSPVRYAFSAGDDYLKKLLDEVETLTAVTDEEDRQSRIQRIIHRSTVFDHGQQDLLKKKIADLKLAKKRDLNKQFNAAEEAKKQEFVDEASRRTDTVVIGSNIYQKVQPFGYASLKQGQGDSAVSRVFATFDIFIEEERTLVDEAGNTRILFGVFRSPGQEVRFEVPDEVWNDDSAFWLYFYRLGGTDFNVLRGDIQILRQVVSAHGKSSRRVSVVYGTQGWHGQAFLMPSVIVDAMGIRANTEQLVDISRKEHAHALDFKILDDDEFRRLLLHIKTDFLNAFPRHASFLGIGHMLMAPFIAYLRLSYKPVFWLEGDSGVGKTQFCLLLQNFWGRFAGGANWKSSSIGMSEYGHQFKDCMLLADNFKAMSIYQTKHCIDTIHNAYEYSVRGVANRDGTLRRNVTPRCLYLMSGEVVPENDASFIGRLTLLTYPRFDQTKTKEAFDRCMSRSQDYCGITPRFIHWALQLDKAEWKQGMELVRAALQKDISHVTNSSRIANNVGLAYTGWRLFVRFMLEAGVLEESEAKQLDQEGWDYANETKEAMSVRCVDEQVGNVFLANLKELLLTGRLGIKGIVGLDHERAVCIGFASKDDPNIAYVYPGMAIEQVTKAVGGHYVVTPNSIGSQLKTAGVITESDERRHTVDKRHNGHKSRVWKIHLEKLGLGIRPQLVSTPPQSEPPVNQDGLV